MHLSFLFSSFFIFFLLNFPFFCNLFSFGNFYSVDKSNYPIPFTFSSFLPLFYQNDINCPIANFFSINQLIEKVLSDYFKTVYDPHKRYQSLGDGGADCWGVYRYSRGYL